MTLYKKFRGNRGCTQQQFCRRRKIPQVYTTIYNNYACNTTTTTTTNTTTNNNNNNNNIIMK